MTSFKALLAFGTSLCLVNSGPIFAQEEDETEDGYGGALLEEIVVTGRKREESLQDVPISITVLNSNVLAEQNVLDQGGLAELIPGFFYNEGDEGESDRSAALPSIRGVSSNEIATNRTKVTSFIDGIPILGSVGAINIGGAAQVEVYNGPQSAAFGRSTFAGAINYVTRDPGDEIEGSIGVNWGDQGTRIISGSVGGPISETLGFQLAGSFEDSKGPDGSYTYTDGTEAGTRGGNNLSARFVWKPTDNFDAKLTFTHDEIEDGPAAVFYATQASSEACFNSLTTFPLNTGMGPPGLGTDGVFDCEFDVDTSTPLQAVNNVRRYYDENPDVLQALVDDAVANGATDGEFGDYTVEEAILLIADAYSVGDGDIGTFSERDRIITQLDYVFDSGDSVQLSFMKGKEEGIREYANYNSATPYAITYAMAQPPMPPMGPVPATPATPARYNYGAFDINGGFVPMADHVMSDPTDIDETYVEVRWASPSEERIRYIAGGSYYEYDFLTQVYLNGGYNAVRQGTTDDLELLTTVDLTDAVNTRTISEFTENYALFGSVAYDFSDKLTGSIEGRYAKDKVGGFLPSENFGTTVTNTSFTPRIALNYNPTEKTTYYIQYAEGVNPGGINAELLNETARDYLDNGVPVRTDPTGAIPIDLNDESTFTRDPDNVNFRVADYEGYDEEKLKNLEFGFKGSIFDDRLSYSGAVYYMIWEDAIQRLDLNWDYRYADNDLAGQAVVEDPGFFYAPTTNNTSAAIFANQGESTTKGIELQANFRINENWSINGNTSFMQAEYTDFCSAALFTGLPNDLGEYAGLEESTVTGNPCYVLDGKELSRQPSFTLSLSPSYRTELNSGVGFSVSARYQYQASSYNDLANVSETPPSKQFNFTVGLTKDAWSGTIYVENLLNEKNITSANAAELARYTALYPDNAADLDPDLYFGDANQYSHYSFRIPTGRTFGFRANYNF